jgi:hypothetical protein
MNALRVAWVVVVVALGSGCKGKEKQAAPPAPAPTPAPAVQPAPAPPAPAPSSDDKLVDALLGDATLVGYSAQEKTAVYPLEYSVEGTGSALEIAFEKAGGEPETIAIYEAGDEPEPAIAAKRAEVAARIRGKGYVALEASVWPEGVASVALPGRMDTLEWAKGALVRVAPDGKRTTLDKPKLDKGYTASPQNVYAALGEDTVIVRYWIDPGEGYGEGLNASSHHAVLTLAD